MKRLLLSILLLSVSLLVGCGGGSNSGGGGGGGNPTLVSIQVTPANPSVTLGATPATQQFTATGTFSDNTTRDLTASASWSSSATTVATVSAGLATGVAAGTATISASSAGVSGSTVLTVNPAPLVSIAVTPANPSVVVNAYAAVRCDWNLRRRQHERHHRYSGVECLRRGKHYRGGLATAGSAAGASTITATSGSISGTTTLTVTNPLVSITVTPTNPSAAPGTKPQFTATGLYADNTSQNITASVTWTSSSTAVATINNAAGLQGQATAVAPGTTTITATLGSVSGSTTP